MMDSVIASRAEQWANYQRENLTHHSPPIALCCWPQERFLSLRLGHRARNNLAHMSVVQCGGQDRLAEILLPIEASHCWQTTIGFVYVK